LGAVAKRTKGALAAKLSAPRISAIHPRPRLLDLIDEARGRSLVWIEGPAGSGKTTVAADYVRSRRLKAIWYRFDDRDADPASFFYYLRRAVSRISPRRRETLPLLTPAYLEAPSVFARNFFEEVYARLKRPAALVLDDFHELPARSILLELLPQALAAVPDGIIALVLSRNAPPPGFAALRARSRLATLGGEELNFKLDETRGLARLHGAQKLSASSLTAIHGRTRGWAAGLVLTLEHARATNTTVGETPGLTREALFHYFATVLLGHAAPDERDLLLKTSVLPQVSAAHAEALAQSPGAGEVLADLVRRNFFTVRTEGAGPVYQYHPLFRDFLHARLRETVTAEEYRELCRSAAALMAESGDATGAGSLLIAAQDHSGLAALVLAHAEPLARSGRYATLAAWLAELPKATIETEPWLACWLAMTEFPRDPAGALERTRRAMAMFQARGDLTGLGLALSMYGNMSVADIGGFRGFDSAVAQLVAPITPQTTFPTREIDLRVAGGMLVLLLWSQPWRETIEPWARRAEALLADVADPELGLLVTHQLAMYHFWCGERLLAEEVITAATRKLDWNATDPLLAMAWTFLLQVRGWYAADRERWESAVGRGIAIAEKHGLTAFSPNILGQAVYGALSEGDVALAARYLPRIEAAITLGTNLGTSNYRFMCGWEALTSGDLPRAIELLSSSFDLAVQINSPFGEAMIGILLAQALYEADSPEEAERNLAHAEDIEARMQGVLLRIMALFTRADEARRRGRNAAAEGHLRDALPAMRTAGLVNFPGWRNDFMARVLSTALRFGIEKDYVVSLIRRRNLSPPPDAPDLEAWPWPVRIQTLGRFSALRDGVPLAAAAAASARPIELLKALIALGGRDVDETKLAEQLWPSAEGDRAHRNLQVNVHRLRGLLGKECVIWNKGSLSLDARCVWIDAWALERALGTLEATLKTQRVEDIAAVAATALALNRGEFLRGDMSPWALSARERLRAKFLRVLDAAAEALGALGRTQEALRCYEKGLEIDPVAERFFQGLMRCHLDLGHRADGLAVYQRCREALARELRLAPSAKTESLHTALLSD
jgi:DNA-binding SARP family transcriptional activator